MKLAIPHMIEYCKQTNKKNQQQPKTIGYVILLNKLFWNDEMWCMKRQFDRKDSSCGNVNVKVESDWIIGACLSLLHTFNLYLQALLLRCRWSLKLKEVWPWLMDCKRFSLCPQYHREPVLMWIFMLSMKTTFVIIWSSYITFFACLMKGVKVFYFESSICTKHFALDCGSVLCLGTWRLAKSLFHLVNVLSHRWIQLQRLWMWPASVVLVLLWSHGVFSVAAHEPILHLLLILAEVDLHLSAASKPAGRKTQHMMAWRLSVTTLLKNASFRLNV